MNNGNKFKSLISASHVARLICEPVGKLLKQIHTGAIQPDQVAMEGRLFLFDRNRVDEIRDRLNTLDHATCEPDALTA